MVAQALWRAGPDADDHRAFFHAPALLTTWRRTPSAAAVAFAAGVVLMLAIVLAWVVLYGRSAPTLGLSAQLATDIARHTNGSGFGEALRHLARAPFLLLLNAAPASLVLLALVVPRARGDLRGLLGDPWLALCAFALAWAVLWIAVLPGAQPREIVPRCPPPPRWLPRPLRASIDPLGPLWPWAVLGGAWAALLLLGSRTALLRPRNRGPRV